MLLLCFIPQAYLRLCAFNFISPPRRSREFILPLRFLRIVLAPSHQKCLSGQWQIYQESWSRDEDKTNGKMLRVARFFRTWSNESGHFGRATLPNGRMWYGKAIILKQWTEQLWLIPSSAWMFTRRHQFLEELRARDIKIAHPYYQQEEMDWKTSGLAVYVGRGNASFLIKVERKTFTP